MPEHAAILPLPIVSSIEVPAPPDGARAKCLPMQEGRPAAAKHVAQPLWSHFRPGQLLELSGRAPGKLSTVARLILRAQSEGEPVAWVAAREGASFYPPDFAQAGIDLSALVVVRVPLDAAKQNGAHALLRASEVLLRSGAFGMVVIDFAVSVVPRGELAWQARLSGLVRKHEARAVLLTSSSAQAASLGPLIGLRIEPHTVCQVGREGTRVLLTSRVIKSKLGSHALVSPDVRALPVGAEPARGREEQRETASTLVLAPKRAEEPRASMQLVLEG